jgi:hypothetical protein
VEFAGGVRRWSRRHRRRCGIDAAARRHGFAEPKIGGGDGGGGGGGAGGAGGGVRRRGRRGSRWDGEGRHEEDEHPALLIPSTRASAGRLSRLESGLT